MHPPPAWEKEVKDFRKFFARGRGGGQKFLFCFGGEAGGGGYIVGDNFVGGVK